MAIRVSLVSFSMAFHGIPPSGFRLPTSIWVWGRRCSCDQRWLEIYWSIIYYFL